MATLGIAVLSVAVGVIVFFITRGIVPLISFPSMPWWVWLGFGAGGVAILSITAYFIDSAIGIIIEKIQGIPFEKPQVSRELQAELESSELRNMADGIVDYQSGMYKLAIPYFHNVIRINPANHLAVTYMRLAYSKLAAKEATLPEIEGQIIAWNKENGVWDKDIIALPRTATRENTDEILMQVKDLQRQLNTTKATYPDGLTQYEITMLIAMAEGRTDEEIATMLDLKLQVLPAIRSGIHRKTDTPIEGFIEAREYVQKHKSLRIVQALAKAMQSVPEEVPFNVQELLRKDDSLLVKILTLLAEGYTQAEIGSQVGLHRNRVGSRLRDFCSRIGGGDKVNETYVVSYAMQHGIIQGPVIPRNTKTS